MFTATEGETLKAIVESLKDRAAELLCEAETVERAWKDGCHSDLRDWGYLPAFEFSKCEAKGETAIADTGKDCATGEALIFCKCGHIS